MDSIFRKSEHLCWADEVEKELNLEGFDDQASVGTTETLLYYTTSSSLPSEDIRQTRKKRSSGRSKQRAKNKSRQSENDKNSVKDEQTTQKQAQSRSKSAIRAAVVALVQMRRRDFEFGAATHAWTVNFDEREKQRQQHKSDDELATPSSSKSALKAKHRNVVCHQAKAGPVLVVTRTKPRNKPPCNNKDSKTQQIKPAQSKKLKGLPPLSPAPSRSSRADSSTDWKSDKLSTADVPTNNAASSMQFQIATPKSKNPSRKNKSKSSRTYKHDHGTSRHQ